jgi:hypothetical protein
MGELSNFVTLIFCDPRKKKALTAHTYAMRAFWT